ncbi:hypothetical protein KXD40_005920 [Peronospora effusa]|uniref:Uncharacterized protein n=1 Tax=Peronospora effusa TaxID=542832 RepID=A0A3M6VNI2_9STRA|nr:hypothetical protein DD238_001486 [Peronospora effusa]RQM16828.1 hypothetical protein DD237_002473 [Peronospora effusa]UIZ27580.1 hypothetical protein KXD40_005920 [Peronospora effusa]
MPYTVDREDQSTVLSRGHVYDPLEMIDKYGNQPAADLERLLTAQSKVPIAALLRSRMRRCFVRMS